MDFAYAEHSLELLHLALYDEVVQVPEAKRLYGRGLGWTDVNLIVSAQLTGCGLMTFDKALIAASTELGLRG